MTPDARPMWRISATYPADRHRMTLYVTPYENLAMQEWKNTPRPSPPFTDLRLQRRPSGGEWEDIDRA